MEHNRPTANIVEVFAVLKRFNRFLNASKAVERAIYFEGCDRRECNGEHSWQLGELADFLNVRCKLGLDSLKLYRYANRHDFVETYAGETPAFPDQRNMFNILPHCTSETKVERERKALEQMSRDWGEDYPQLLEIIHAYEARSDPEACFVYSLDKLVSSLNCAQDNGRTNILLEVTWHEENRVKGPKMIDPFIKSIWQLFSEENRQRPELYYQEPERLETAAE